MKIKLKYLPKYLTLITLLFSLLLTPLSTQAKTVKIRSNIYQNEFNRRFKDKKLRSIMKLIVNGEIGYVGKFEDVYTIMKEINAKCGYDSVTWYYIKRDQNKSYYNQFLQAKNKAVTDDEITYKNKQSYLIFYIKLRIQTGNLAKQRKKYWALARRAVKKAKVQNGDSDKVAVKKIAYWICKHTRYAFSKYDNCEKGTLFTKGKGVCRDYSDAFWAMCKVCGIPCRYYTSRNHGWNRVKIKGKWYWIDVTWMDCGRYVNKRYYLKRKLWKNHKVTELVKKDILVNYEEYVDLK